MRLRKFFTILFIIFLSPNLHAQTGPAATFLTTAGVTDPTQVAAINVFVTDIQAVPGLWAKMRVIYPFVGGNDVSHSYNLKDPQTYRITWGGTVAHDATGITGNGISGYGDTHFTFNNLYHRDPNIRIWMI